MRRATSWRLALRLARRDALRHRGRSILVLVMIALPVLAVTAADVVISTQDVSAVESLDRRLGTADALVLAQPGGPVLQGFDPDWYVPAGDYDKDVPPPTADDVVAVLGDARLVELRNGLVKVRTEHGVVDAEATEVDLRDPITRGMFDLTSGGWPTGTDQVVVNQALLDRGYRVGDRLEPGADGGPSPLIVGVAESTSTRSWPSAAGSLGSLRLDADDDGRAAGWLVDSDPVTWDAVRDLNAVGATALSRAVVTDPPPASVLPDQVRATETTDEAAVAVLALIVVMALLELVLLAGPAFAVTARRQARTLALVAASGGTPAQSRRVILGVGAVLGSLAALVGVVLGIVAGWLLVPVLQRWSDDRFGPFDVPWAHLAGIALFGVLSALLAAVAPAWIASRQDVVAVLAGRRSDARPSLRSPLLGLVLLGAGIAGSAYGARAGGGTELAIAASAVLAVLGMILLVPIVVVGVARAAGRLPLSPRYAARDAARHRTRTVPAVAAVAATVAGVVALGIGVTSDEAENRETYRPELPAGMGVVHSYADGPVDWPTLRAAVAAELPDAGLTDVRGLRDGAGQWWLDLQVDADDEPDRILESFGDSWGPSVLVGEQALTDLPIDIPEGQRAAAHQMLRYGGIVAFTDQGVEADRLHLGLHRWDEDSEEETVTEGTAPALLVSLTLGNAGPQAILSDEVAERLGMPVGTAGLLLDGPLTEDQERAVGEALTAADDNASVYVERGYQAPEGTVVVQLVLAGLGAALMLGGTLTATFLALSDARPDLATLAAVGAPPSRRRAVGASYALVIGLVGAVLGAVVGFIPGIAITYPLTRGYSSVETHFVDVPWVMILGVVVLLPLLTAGVVALATRARLPMGVRLD